MDGDTRTAKALLVIGMHRSGTSMLTRVLNLLGADLPKNLLAAQPDNPKGFWEASDVLDFHDQALASFGSEWDDFYARDEGWMTSPAAHELEEKILTFLEENFHGSPLFVIKDPRLTLLVPVWLRALRRFNATPHFVVAFRHPLEVAESLRIRNGFSQDKSFLLWLRYMLDAEQYSRGVPRCFCGYEETLNDWRSVIEKLEGTLRLLLRDNVPVAEIDNFIEPRLRNHVASDSKLVTTSLCEWISAVYQWLCEATSNPNANPSPLESVRGELALHDQFMAPIVKQLQAQSEAAAADFRQLREDLAEAAQARARLWEDLERMKQSFASLRHAHQMLALELGETALPPGSFSVRVGGVKNRYIRSAQRVLHLGRRAVELALEGRLWSKVRERLEKRRVEQVAPEAFYWGWNQVDANGKISAARHCELLYGNPSQQLLDEPNLRDMALRIAFNSSPDEAAPAVSVIIPVYNNIYFTLICLDHLARHQTRHLFEVLVVDDCSTDLTAVILPQIPGCRHLPTESNNGFIKACNYGLSEARGNICVFLNNDTAVLPGWLDELVETFGAFPDAGIVGSQLLYPDGTLQEAGGLIWSDGSAWNYGRNDLRLRHEYNYVRDVSYVSGASLAIPRGLALELGGFDEHFCPAYGEDSDLAFRVRATGRRVLYQPFSRLVHFEGLSSGRDISQGVKAYQAVNAQKLTERWKAQMQTFPAPGTSPDIARDGLAQRRALVIDACTPLPDQDSGSVTALGVMRGLQALGFKVCFVPQSNMTTIPGYTEALQRIGIEAVYNTSGFSYPFIEDYAQAVGDIFDVVVIFRVTVATQCIDAVRAHMPSAKVVFFTSDLHFLRELRQAELSGSQVDRRKAQDTQKQELGIIAESDCCIVHSDLEKEIIARALPGAVVELYGWSIDVASQPAPFAQRRDFVFLGGYQHPPNVDAVLYFVEVIFPLLKARMPDARFLVLGSHPPASLLKLASEDIVISGYVPDLGPFLGASRVGVVPLRYGAGIKGKIAMMMSHGLPVVTTSTGAEGMGLNHEQEALVEDSPQGFADMAVRLHSDQQLWERLAAAGLELVRRQYSQEASTRRIREILQRINAL